MDFIVQDLNAKKFPQNRQTNTSVSPNQQTNPRAYQTQQQKVFPQRQSNQNVNYRGPPPPQYQNPNPRVMPPPRQPMQSNQQFPKNQSHNQTNHRFPPPNSQNQQQPQYQRKNQNHQSRGNYQGYQGNQGNQGSRNNDRDHSQSPNQNYGNRGGHHSDSRSPNNFNARGNRGRGRGRGGRPYQPQESQYQQQVREFVEKNFADHPVVRNMGKQRGRGGNQNYQQRQNRPDSTQQMKGRSQKFGKNYAKQPLKSQEQPKQKPSQKNQDYQNEDQEEQQQSVRREESEKQQSYSDQQQAQGSYDQESQSHDRGQSQQLDYDDEQEDEKSVEQKQEQDFYQQNEEQMSDQSRGSVDLRIKNNKTKQKKIPNDFRKLPQVNYPSTSRCIDDMCSKQEFQDRMDMFNINNRDSDSQKLRLDTSRSFSVFEINKITMKPDFTLTLKRFRRSADRAEEGVAEDTRDLRRSIKALAKVITHVGRQILDADHMDKKYLAFPLPPGEKAFQFIHIYDFLWDRMRQMIKDITRLNQKQQITKQIITISEQIARFFILGINQGRKESSSRLQFDEKMNKQSIVKILTILKEFYHNSRMELKKLILQNKLTAQNVKPGQVQELMKANNIYISPHEPQIISYVFLFSNDRKKEFYQILSVGQSSQNPLFESEQIQNALQIHKLLNQRNYQQYFQYLQSDKIDYLMSCLMLHHLNTVRKEAVKVIFKTQICQGVKNSIFTEELKQILRFKQKNNEEFERFLAFLDVQKKNKMLICNDPHFRDDVKVYKIPEYVFNNNKLKRDLFTKESPTKRILDQSLISRQQIVNRSWKKPTYDRQIIAFYLGAQYDPSIYVNNVSLSKSPLYSQESEQQQEQEISQLQKAKKNKKISTPKVVKHSKEIKQPAPEVPQQKRQTQKVLQLQNMRKIFVNKKKTDKRVQVLSKIQQKVKSLFRQTDKEKQLKQKKFIAIVDEWMMYYHDKMLKIGLDKIHYESRKKVLIQSLFQQILEFKKKRKTFASKINRCPYEFDPQIYVQRWGSRYNLEAGEVGVMSKMLQRMQPENEIPIYQNFQQALASFSISRPTQTSYNILIMSTLTTSDQNSGILINLIKYFTTKAEELNKHDLSRVISMVDRLNKDKLMKTIQQSFFLDEYKKSIKITLVKILEVNNKGKKNLKKQQQSLHGYLHLIPHFFGCHNAIILRQNGRPQAVNPILKIFQEFQDTSTRVCKSNYEMKKNVRYKTLKFIELPILIINTIKYSQKDSKVKSLIKSEGLKKMMNIDQINISENVQSYNFSHFMRETLAFSLQKSVYYEGKSPLKKYAHEEARMEVKELKTILRQIKVNASGVEEKIKNFYGEFSQNYENINTFVFYQQYFNMCIEQLIDQIFWCFDNCKYEPQWPTYLNELQNREDAQMDEQTQINLISDTYYQMQLMEVLCQRLKMNFVGPDVEKLDKQYLLDNYNIMNQKTGRGISRGTSLSYDQMQNMVRFHQTTRVITEYIDTFDQDRKSFNDQKAHALKSIFDQYKLKLRVYEVRRKIKINKVEQQKYEFLENSHLLGNSVELFNFILTCLIQNVEFINIVVPKNFKFLINSQEYEKRIEVRIGKQIRRKQHPFGIAPGIPGKQHLIQKLVKKYYQTHKQPDLPQRAGPHFPLIQYLEPEVPASQCRPAQKIPSIQNIQLYRQMQKSQSKYRQTNNKRPHPIDVDELQTKKDAVKKRTIQNMFDSYSSHTKNTTNFKYERSEMLDSIRKQIKLSNG